MTGGKSCLGHISSPPTSLLLLSLRPLLFLLTLISFSSTFPSTSSQRQLGHGTVQLEAHFPHTGTPPILSPAVLPPQAAAWLFDLGAGGTMRFWRWNPGPLRGSYPLHYQPLLLPAPLPLFFLRCSLTFPAAPPHTHTHIHGCLGWPWSPPRTPPNTEPADLWGSAPRTQ